MAFARNSGKQCLFFMTVGRLAGSTNVGCMGTWRPGNAMARSVSAGKTGYRVPQKEATFRNDEGVGRPFSSDDPSRPTLQTLGPDPIRRTPGALSIVARLRLWLTLCNAAFCGLLKICSTIAPGEGGGGRNGTPEQYSNIPPRRTRLWTDAPELPHIHSGIPSGIITRYSSQRAADAARTDGNAGRRNESLCRRDKERQAQINDTKQKRGMSNTVFDEHLLDSDHNCLKRPSGDTRYFSRILSVILADGAMLIFCASFQSLRLISIGSPKSLPESCLNNVRSPGADFNRFGPL